MKYLVTGGNGQLGKALQNLGINATFTDLDELDITDEKSLSGVDWNNYDAIINAAAYTDVDRCETTANELNWSANSVGPANLAKIASEFDLKLVHISSDYVFDGTKSQPYLEADMLSPLSSYGAAKAAADIAVSRIADKHYIIRTSWVIGEGKNFVNIMSQLFKSQETLTVIDDNVGRPTFASTLARGIVHLIEGDHLPGTYNLTNDGDPISWLGFASKIADYLDSKVRLSGVSTTDYYKDKPAAANRPINSELDLSKIKSTGLTIPNWEASLKEYLEDQR